MTDTQEPTRVTSGTGSQPVGTRRKGASLASMLLPELQQLAASLGINTTKMRKSDLVAAIQNRQTTVASADGHATDSVAIPPQVLPMDETAVAVVLLAETAPPSAPEAPPAAVNGGSDQRTRSGGAAWSGGWPCALARLAARGSATIWPAGWRGQPAKW